nr:uncertain protease [Schizochytrium aggregatum ATCC 28209]
MKVAAALVASAIAAVANAVVVQKVPRSWIVEAHDCDGLETKIDQLKLAIDGVNSRNAEGYPLARRIHTSCFVSFEGSANLAAEVGQLTEVKYVEQNEAFTVSLPIPDEGDFDAAATKSWGLDRIDGGLDGADWKGTWDGTGVTVYIVDTGINANHNDFGGRATAGPSFVSGESNGNDGNGHGSHCAGTATGGSYGIARKAQVVGVKVLSASGSGTNQGVLDGINWAVNDASRPSVISMSLGGGRSTAIDNAVKAAANAGHIVTVAAGNDNADSCNYSPAAAGGNGPNGGVVTVASTTQSDARSSFSNYGSGCTDIFAPGSSITSVWIGSSSDSNTISGTSMACPHVAGVAATLLQKHNFNKNAAIAELFNSAETNQISDARNTPNLLLKAATDPINGSPVSAPTPIPTRPPATTPTTRPPTPRPTTNGIPSSWRCPTSWYSARDGCDCECGAYDPDCDVDGADLYCNGNRASWWYVCDFNTDTCRISLTRSYQDAKNAGRDTTVFTVNKNDVSSSADDSAKAPAGASNGDMGIAVGLSVAGALVGAAIVGSAIINRRTALSVNGVGSVYGSKHDSVVGAPPAI